MTLRKIFRLPAVAALALAAFLFTGAAALAPAAATPSVSACASGLVAYAQAHGNSVAAVEALFTNTGGAGVAASVSQAVPACAGLTTTELEGAAIQAYTQFMATPAASASASASASMATPSMTMTATPTTAPATGGGTGPVNLILVILGVLAVGGGGTGIYLAARRRSRA